MIASGGPTIEQLADRLVRTRTAGSAEKLVIAVDADCFTELVVRSGLAGRLTRELFELLDCAFDAHLAAREIRALPEAAG